MESIKILSQVEHKVFNYNGNGIHYYLSGDKANEVIVFLHSAFGDHRIFDQQVDYFSKRYRVITIDLIGHGLSKVKNTNDKIDKSTDHIKMILEKEGYNNVHLVGVSLGSLIAQYFALQFPDSVKSLTVLGGYDINKIDKEIIEFQNKGKFKWIFQALFAMDSFRNDITLTTVKSPESQARFFEMTKLFTRKSFLVMSGVDKIIKNRKDIQRKYPVMILAGDKDLDLSIESAKLFHQSVPESKFFLIDNAGHCANMDNDKEFNGILLNFLEEI